MSELLWPVAATGVSDDFWAHKNRTPPSVNPGTDIKAPYGSPFWSPEAGRVTGMSTSPSGSGGRFLQITLDNGWVIQSLHLLDIAVSLGQRVARGQFCGHTGASAYGSDWGTDGPHIHESLKIDGVNVDFQDYSSPDGSVPAGSGSTPITPETEEDIMSELSPETKKFITDTAHDQTNSLLIEDKPEIGQVSVMTRISALLDQKLAALGGQLITVEQREERARLYHNTDTGERIAIGDKLDGGHLWLTLGSDQARGQTSSLRDKQLVGDTWEQSKGYPTPQFTTLLHDAGIQYPRTTAA